MKPESIKKLQLYPCCENCKHNSEYEAGKIQCEKHDFYQPYDAVITICDDWGD